MEMKDWIQIVVEIIGNGVLLVCFGKWIDLKFKRAERNEELRSNTIKEFYNELLKLNKALINVNATVHMNKITNTNTIIQLLKEKVLSQWIEIVAFYDTYECELKVFEKEYRDLSEAWTDFTKQKTPQDYGEKLETFKQKNKDLIAVVRKNY